MSNEPNNHGQRRGVDPAGAVRDGPVRPRRRFNPLIAVVAIGALAGGLGLFGAAVRNIEKDRPGAQPSAQPQAGGVGEPVRDGELEFVVTAVSCGRKTVGSGLLASTARGEYCLVWVRVANVGTEARTFTGGSQRALDQQRVEYSNDGGAELAVNSGAPTFLREIVPGDSVTGTLVFDVPPGTKLAGVELHDSFYSTGATVTLR